MKSVMQFTAVLVWAAISLPAMAQSDAVPLEPDAPFQLRHLEGAVGLNASSAPAYQGSDERKSKLAPGFFLRYGRFSITNSSGYVSRQADDVQRGLGIDLRSSDRLRVNLALRYDQGRSEADAEGLRGMGTVKSTVRVRASASYRLDDGWRLGGAWSVDAFGRGGGNFGDVGVAREIRLGPHTVWTSGANLSLGGDRYLQTYFGVTPEQAQRSGYAVFTPKMGLRDVSAFSNVRVDLDTRWRWLGGVALTHMLGSAADSPLTRKATAWGLSTGLAWRF